MSYAGVKALTFDTGGTILAWHSGFRNALHVVCAAPDYLVSHGEPSHPIALSMHYCLLQQSLREVDKWQFQEDGKPMSVRVQGKFRANSPSAITRLAAE